MAAAASRRPPEYGMGDPLLKIVIRQRAAVMAAVLVCVAAAAAYLWVATPQYTSMARLQVRRTGPRIIGESQAAQTPEENFLFTQREVISSTPVLTIALSKPGVADLKAMRGVNDRLAWLKQ